MTSDETDPTGYRTTNELHVAPGHPARRPAGWALWCSALTSLAFVAFAYATTQSPGIRDGSPWQNDPYDGVVSFTEFLVPTVLLLVLARATLWRRGQPQPAFRINQLTRAGLVSTVLVGMTVVTDWLAVALGADRALWDDATPWLIAGLVPLTLLATASLVLQRVTLRKLPHTADDRPDGDWLDDLAELAQRVTGRRAERPVGFVREHIVAFAVLLSLITSTGITTLEAVGEGWDNPLLFVVGVLIGLGGFLAFCLISNVVLHIAVPCERTPRRRPGSSRLRRATWIAVIAGALALPVCAVLRDRIWLLLGSHAEVDSVGVFAGITIVGALLIGILAFGAGLTWSRGSMSRL